MMHYLWTALASAWAVTQRCIQCFAMLLQTEANTVNWHDKEGKKEPTYTLTTERRALHF